MESRKVGPRQRVTLLKRSAAVTLLAVAPLALGRPAAAQALQKLRVVTTPTESGAQIYYGLELGLFARAGIDVEIISLQSGSPAAAAVASGSIDVGQGNITSIASAHEHGLPFVLIAPASLYSSTAPTSALIVPKDSPVKTAGDLAGKIVANTGMKNIGEIAADNWIDQQGASVSAVKFIESAMTEMPAAMLRGRVQAAVVVEPFLSAALANGFRVLSYPYTAIAPSFMIGAYFANRDWVRGHADTVRKFADVILETARWANNPANHSRSAVFVEKYTKIQIQPGMTRVRYAERLDPALIQPLIDASAKYQAIGATFPAAELLR